MQHPFDDNLRALQKIVLRGRFTVEQGLVSSSLVFRKRLAESLQSEGADELRPADSVGRGRGLARYQPVRVSAAKRRARQFLRGSAVRVGEQRSNILRLILALKPVDKILRGKLIGGVTLFAQ